MPLGTRQNSNLLHLALDIWQDQAFFQENAYPSGHFAAEILNISEETLQNLITYGGAISHQVETLAHANRGQFIALLPETRASLENMLTVLWRCPPYNLLNQGQELQALEVMFSSKSYNDLLNPSSPARNFFFRYLTAAFCIPLGICHFSAAGRYFEAAYLRRLKKRTETFFAVAAHDCFNSHDFWDMMDQLPLAEIERYTVAPTVASTYVFARSHKNEKEMVFVQRNSFSNLIHFYIFDLMNGLHHGHAPSQCQNCGRYFLTTNGHIPKYCDGTAPQDSHMTCRQYGAMMHQKEQNKQHPIYRLSSTRTNTIRKHHQRGKISDDLRREAIRLAESYRDKALLNNDYAEHSYALDMEQEHLYGKARKRVREKEGG